MERIGLLVWTAVCSALIVCGAYIAVPLSFTPVPIVLQNLFVMLAGLLLGPWWGGLSVAVYLLLGVIGLPVFAGGAGGVAHLLGPTGGYLVGFLVAALLIGAISRPSTKERNVYKRHSPTATAHSIGRDIVAVVVGILIVYAVGVPWLMRTTQASLVGALLVGVVPFLIGDAIKALLAVLIARFVRARRLLPRGQ